MQTFGAVRETASSSLVTTPIFPSARLLHPFYFIILQEATTTPPLADDMSPEEVLHLFLPV